MPQTILDFTVESTSEKLTSRTGVILLGEYLKGIRLDSLSMRYLPSSTSNRAYPSWNYINALILSLHSGGRVLDDIKMIHNDQAMRKTLKMNDVPKADTIGKWLKRTGLLGVYGIEKINAHLLKSHLKRCDLNELVLDIDATVIEAEKSTARSTYKGPPGYTPIVGHINGGFLIHSEFRTGNIAPADTNLTFTEKCIKQLPKGVKLKYLRADGASYQVKILNYCFENNITFTIGAHLSPSTRAEITKITTWKQHSKYEQIAEYIDTMKNVNQAYRLIVIKKRITPMLPHIEDLLTPEQKQHYFEEHYHVIATNDLDHSANEMLEFYRQRGETSENRIKELKRGFNMSYMPTSDFMANAFYFAIGTLAYNLFVLFKQTFENSWQKHTVQTIRYKLYNIASKVISHSRKTILKVNDSFLELINRIRQKSYQISLQ